MRILLIRPGKVIPEGIPVRIGTPSGLLSISATIRRHKPDAEVRFLDSFAEGTLGKNGKRLGEAELARKIKEIKPDLVGISCLYTNDWAETLLTARIAKQVDPKVTVVLGGHHPAFTSEYVLEEHPSTVDAVVKGEGEMAMLGILDKMEAGDKVSGLVHGKAVTNLDELPDPDLSILTPSRYPIELIHWPTPPKGKNFIDMIFSRGCPIGCDYCTTKEMWGKRIRAFSPQRIKAQIRMARERGFEEIAVEDDNMLLLPRKTIAAICNGMKEAGMPWVEEGGLYYPRITEEFVQMIGESGCYSAMISVENPSLELMRSYNKYKDFRKTLEEQKAHILKVAGMFAKEGVAFYSVMMTGFPEEKRENLGLVEEFAKFLREIGSQAVYFFFLHPYPGTCAGKDVRILEGRGWEDHPEYWSLASKVCKSEITEDDLLQLHKAVNGDEPVFPTHHKE